MRNEKIARILEINRLVEELQTERSLLVSETRNDNPAILVVGEHPTTTARRMLNVLNELAHNDSQRCQIFLINVGTPGHIDYGRTILTRAMVNSLSLKWAPSVNVFNIKRQTRHLRNLNEERESKYQQMVKCSKQQYGKLRSFCRHRR